jgi:predicted nucleotidyltransferase
MKRHLQSFRDFINEAEDPTYYQETFYFTMLISMAKERGGSRDETKNDIRALSEILTVTLVESEKGGIQRDIGTKYLSTLKIHVRKPKDVNKKILMKNIVKQCAALRGVTVLRYKERKPKPRRTAFRGHYKITEGDYYQSPAHKAELQRDTAELTGGGPQKTGGAPFNRPSKESDWEQAPPGAPGGLEEAALDEAMVTADKLPENIVVAIDKSKAPRSYRAYYALKDNPSTPLKAGDLDRMEAGIEVYGNIYAELGQDFPYEGHYVVTSVKAADKYGPLLYDVMLELVGKAGLKPDTESVSDDASAVWKFYDGGSRPVHAAHLGPAGEPLPLDQYSAVMPEDRASAPEQNEHLAKVYFKEDRSTLDALASTNKLADAKESTRPSAREEFADLAKELDIPVIKKHQDLSRFDRLREEILVTVGDDLDLMAFDVQPDLNQKIWEGDKGVRPGVKGALIDIIEEFLEGLELDADVKDIVLTGSLANYNWSKFSDIDLHILMDFTEINENERLVKKFFDAVRSRWNKLHDIRVKGHEVEIYVQDEHEPHTSTGVYSLLNDEWIVKPRKIKPEIDKTTAQKKMISLVKELDKLSAVYNNRRYEEALEMAQRIKDKIKRMRQGGLERTGIYSPENLAFKMLRRSGDIERLFDMYTGAYDQVFSLDQ